MIAEEVRELMAQLGFRQMNKMIGRADRLEVKKAVDHWKAKGLDFSKILYQPEVPTDVGRFCQIPQDHGLEKALDNTVLRKLCAPAIERKEKVLAMLPIRNVHRVVGTIVGSEITRRWGAEGLARGHHRDPFHRQRRAELRRVHAQGHDLLPGRRLQRLPRQRLVRRQDHRLSAGAVHLRARRRTSLSATWPSTAPRAARPTSAAWPASASASATAASNAVVESVGDHGCEYMTGGSVVVLGPTGRNFAAGMSGGVAYVLDEAGDFPRRCNLQMVALEKLEDADEIEQVWKMIQRHQAYTQSALAARILANWQQMVPKFVKVMPKDYKRVLQSLKRVQESGLSGDQAIMAAFEENARDAARIGGG